MTKKHELRQQLSKASDELVAMAGKSEAEGFKQDVYDALNEHITELKARLDRADQAEKVAASLATPVPGQDRMTPFAPPSAHKMYGQIKHFKDREIGGQMVRAVDQAYAAGMWIKGALFGNAESAEWCKMHGVPIVKAQGEGVDTFGGFLVPEELLANIIVLREEYGVFRRECQVVPMGSDTLNWPRRVGGLTAYFTAENTAVTESEAQWDSVNLTAKKLAVLTRMSNEISQDAVVSVADWLVGEMAYAFALAEDNAGFNGNGTSTYGGIRGATNLMVDGNHAGSYYTLSSDTLTSLTKTDLLGVMGILPQYALRNAKWFMSQQTFLSAAGVVLAAGGGNKIEDLQQGISDLRGGIQSATGTVTDLTGPMLLGFPVVISQALPIAQSATSGTIQFMFGDLAKAAALGERRGVIIRRSDHRYFEQDQIGLLGTERFDINVHDVGSATVAGPLVGGKAP